MKIARIRVVGFRCLADVEVSFHALTMCVGSNSAGKSSLLHALQFFFDGGHLEADDVFGREAGGSVSVQVTFDELTDADREAFGVYATGDQMVLRRSWGPEGPKLSGRGLAFPSFDPVKDATGRERTKLYRAIRAQRPELELLDATTIDAVDKAMLTWEMENPDQCEERDRDAGHLFGFSSVGQSILSQRFKYVFVPGLSDAAEEAVERRGSILERLLGAIADQRAQADAQLAELEETTRARYGELVEAAHGETLRGLAEELETHMRRYIPTADIALRPIAAQLRVAPPTIELRGGEQQDISDLGRQGHGFQRTFIIAALEYLAEAAAAEEDVEDRPTLFLAIEEPELYQHPPRARHFFHTLQRLIEESRNVQVAYATHSPYFVSPSWFESIRIFRRVRVNDDGPGGVAVTQATLASVRERSGSDEAEIGRYLARTMSVQLGEAFFARAVLLVEGPTDAAAIITCADLLGTPMQSAGVVVAIVSKAGMPTAIAVLDELEIPTFVVIDSDSQATNEARENAVRANARLLRTLGEDAVEFPPTGVHGRWASFGVDLEHFLRDELEGFSAAVTAKARELMWKPKSPEVYAEVLLEFGPDAVPEAIRQIVTRVLELARTGE